MCTVSHALTIWLELDPIPMMFKIPVEIERHPCVDGEEGWLGGRGCRVSNGIGCTDSETRVGDGLSQTRVRVFFSFFFFFEVVKGGFLFFLTVVCSAHLRTLSFCWR